MAIDNDMEVINERGRKRKLKNRFKHFCSTLLCVMFWCCFTLSGCGIAALVVIKVTRGQLNNLQLVVWRMRNELIKRHNLHATMAPPVYDTCRNVDNKSCFHFNAGST